jgi:hypothetical protein
MESLIENKCKNDIFYLIETKCKNDIFYLIETKCKNDIFCLIHQIKAINDDYLINSIYVYKSCGEYVVILERLLDTITNENRNNITNKECKLFAEYRGSKFLVKDIFHKFDSTKKVSSILSSNFENKLEYKIGKVIIPDNFDTVLENVCSNGIHYFLKLECAFYYSLEKIQNGEYLSWHENGQPSKKCTYTDGKKMENIYHGMKMVNYIINVHILMVY